MKQGVRKGSPSFEAFTPPGHPLLGVKTVLGDDSGADALRAMGMTVTEYERVGLATLSGHPTAEFYWSPASGTDSSMRLDGSLTARERPGFRTAW